MFFNVNDYFRPLVPSTNGVIVLVKITFAVFQNGEYSEDVEGVYEIQDPLNALKLMAELVSNNQFASMPVTRGHTMTSEGLFQPPSTTQGLGPGTIMVVKNIKEHELKKEHGD